VNSIEVFDAKRYGRPQSKAAIPEAVPDRPGLLLLFSDEQFVLSLKTKSVRVELERTLDIPDILSEWLGYTHFSFVECAPEYLKTSRRDGIGHTYSSTTQYPNAGAMSWRRVRRVNEAG
jgi:hypothetical protein